jgi:uncharacterized Ntn-hydrolase superfamily protein
MFRMTFSVAGLCPRTGEIGLALTTSSMAAGARAMFLAPGHGAVFAQARSDPALGALGRARLEAGRSADGTLADLLAATPYAAWRQLGVLDAKGGAAHHTGEHCVTAKGALTAPGALALGNGLANDEVVPAILRGFGANPDLPLVERLIAALDAGLDAGGEPYPLRSAAVQVSRPGIPFPVIDLRVDLADRPLADLRRYWANYAPLLEGYLARATDPANAPLAASFETHLRQPINGALQCA